MTEEREKVKGNREEKKGGAGRASEQTSKRISS